MPPAPVTAAATQPIPIRVWDLPTRLFHWALAAAVVALAVTGEVGGNAMVLHMRLGLAVGALLLFRILWGLVGGRWSRFSSFVRSPGAIVRYVRGGSGQAGHVDVGHNPLGSLSVLAFLFFLAIQVATGLVSDDEIATAGPLTRFVSSAVVSPATSWHADIGKAILIVLVLLHVAAIVYYLRRKQLNLVRPMLTGDKPLPADTPPSRDTRATRLLAAVLLAACGALAVWVNALGAVAAF
jgi:cytochrome b